MTKPYFTPQTDILGLSLEKACLGIGSNNLPKDDGNTPGDNVSDSREILTRHGSMSDGWSDDK